MGELLKRLMLWVFRLFPLQNIIVLESHPDVSDNTYAIYEELLWRGCHNRYKIYWIHTFQDGKKYDFPHNVKLLEQNPQSFAENLERAYVLNCCKYIIDCNSFIKKRRKRQVRFHLGHGMPIKIDLEYSRKVGDCDEYMIQSDFWKEIYTQMIHVPEDKLCTLGYPRNDVLVHPEQFRDRKYEQEGYDKVVAWLPTYRQHRLHPEQAMEIAYPYGMPCVHNKEELLRLDARLKENKILLLFRPHPVQDLSLWEECCVSNIEIADDAFLKKIDCTLYELLAYTDGLITDYSSVYFDYLLTDKPIALTIEDMDNYFQYFTLAFEDYKRFIKGEYVEEFSQLLSFVSHVAQGEDVAREQRMKAKNMFHQDVTGQSAVKIVDLLRDKYKMNV